MDLTVLALSLETRMTALEKELKWIKKENKNIKSPTQQEINEFHSQAKTEVRLKYKDFNRIDEVLSKF